MEERVSGDNKKELEKLISILPGHDLDLEAVKSAFLAHDSVAVLVADDDGNYLYVNPAASKIFGYSEKEFMLMNIRDIRMTDGGNPIKLYRNFVNTGASSGVFHFFDKSDKLKICLYRALRVAEDVNLSMMFDVTEQYNYFDDVIDQLNEQSDVLNNLPSISFRYHYRENGSSMFTFVSDNVSKVLRLPYQKPPTEWALGELILDEDLPEFLEVSKKATEEIRPLIYRARLRLGDGSISDFEVRSFPVRRGSEVITYGTLYLI